MDQSASVAECQGQIRAMPGISLQTAETSFLASRGAQEQLTSTRCWHPVLTLHNKSCSVVAGSKGGQMSGVMLLTRGFLLHGTWILVFLQAIPLPGLKYPL